MGLSAEHAKYCQLRASGDTTRKAAYLATYPNASPDSATTLAARLERRASIKAEIARLQKRSETPLVLSRQEKREFLARVVRTPIGEVDEDSDLCESKTLYYDKEGNHIRTVLKMPGKATCIEIDNKMAGHNEPEKVEHTAKNGVMLVPVGGATLNEWEKHAEAQQAKLKEDAKEKG